MTECIGLQDRRAVKKALPEVCAGRLERGEADTFESRREGILLCFDHYDVGDLEKKPGRTAVFANGEKIVFLAEGQREMDMARSVCQDARGGAEALCRFLEEMIRGDMAVQAEFEKRIIGAEDRVLQEKDCDLVETLTDFRRRLFLMKRYYEQLLCILQGLTRNETGWMGEGERQEMQILQGRVQRLYENAGNLRDYVTQVREAWQSQIGIQQNHLMKTFTVVTAVFSPLSLLAGWYGMNLQLPEFSWRHGYLFVITLAGAIALICYRIFKRRGWLR